MAEGDPGTWSHCGKREPHSPHMHTFAMNEGPYTVQCNGVPMPPPGPAYTGEPTPGQVEQEHIKVRHYGPINGPEDADHSTAIMITRGKFTRVMALENDDELDVLISKLIAARIAADGR